MRKPLLAFGLLITTSIGAFSPAAALAASPPSSPFAAAHSAADRIPLNAVGDSGAATPELAAYVSGSAVVQYAMRFLGYPYTTVGNSPSTGFSCIGFVSYVYQSLGINVPDDLGGAMAFASPVAFTNLVPGDVLFFQNTVWPGLSHTAIYIGGGKFIHAEWYNRGVVISSFTNDPVDYDYWTSHYLGANRPWTAAAGGTAPTRPVQQSPPSPPAPTIQRNVSSPTTPVRVPALNVRARPSLYAALNAVLVRGARVTVLGHRWGWYRVGLPSGSTGWVVGAGIGRGSVPPTQSVARANYSGARGSTAQQSQTLTPVRTIGTVTVQVDGLRVHAAPGVGAAVITVMNRGSTLGVTRRANGWIHVALPSGGAGWISSLYALSGSAVSQRRTQSYRGATAVRRPGAYSRGGSVARAALNVRQRPSLGASVVAVVSPGGTYRVVAWSGGWAYVRLSSGFGGWMSGTVLGLYGSARPRGAHGAAAAVGSSRRASVPLRAGPTVTAGVRIHSGPGLRSPVIGLVAAGTHVRILGAISGWTRVRLPSYRTGYIFGAYVKT